MKNEAEVIRLAEEFVKRELESDRSGHDWWHIHRVRKLAVEMAKHETADGFVCELAALLHDVADEKLNVTKEAGIHKVRNWLTENVNDAQMIQRVWSIISTMSYNGGTNPPMDTLEGQIVQDADRLDALGAIGVARTFTYAGWKGHVMHNPDLPFTDTGYRSNDKTAIYHFYEKLLKLKDLMNTKYAKEIAEKRHQFMEAFLQQFYNEWEGTHERE
jgi:uncharacterized protein